MFAYALVPETKGRSLEAIEADLRENVGTSAAGEVCEAGEESPDTVD